jgi:hypothetical protein
MLWPRQTLLRIKKFDAVGLANVAWGFATMNHPAPLLFDAIADAAQVRTLAEFDTQALFQYGMVIRHDQPPSTIVL